MFATTAAAASAEVRAVGLAGEACFGSGCTGSATAAGATAGEADTAARDGRGGVDAVGVGLAVGEVMAGPEEEFAAAGMGCAASLALPLLCTADWLLACTLLASEGSAAVLLLLTAMLALPCMTELLVGALAIISL